MFETGLWERVWQREHKGSQKMSEPFVKDDTGLSVDVVIPVLNEAHVLQESVETVLKFLTSSLQCRWRIVIVDNGSTDGTSNVAKKLVTAHPEVQLLGLLQKGRGRALRHAWLRSSADIVCYMDVDLSTGLNHIPELVRAIAYDGYDVATGSRLMRESHTKRSLKREMISRLYNILVKAVLFTHFSDAQCGFKALSRKAVEEIVPQIKDQSWFFDTELLVLAEKQGYLIKDVPVVWVEDDDSRVKIIKTGWDDIKGILRLRRQLWNQALAAAKVAKTALPNGGPATVRRVPANADQGDRAAETELHRSA
jgi:glycosyltransferase involved in cell wall biosynthesis